MRDSIAKRGKRSDSAPVSVAFHHEAAYGYPRDFLENQFVYLVISPRAGGLSIGINLNPGMPCNLNCAYCEVNRPSPVPTARLEIKEMVAELEHTLELTGGDWLHQWPRYASLPRELLEVRHVTVSGDGEPTLSPQFAEAMQAVIRLRAQRKFFKIVLVTNSTALDQPKVLKGLAWLSSKDEVWAKLDGGTQTYLNRVNGPAVSLNKILHNILLVGRRRPVVIQSLFPAIHGEEPSEQEIIEYAGRLNELKRGGAEIPLVQIYSATRPMAKLGCTHLSLKTLSRIAQIVRDETGLRTEIF